MNSTIQAITFASKEEYSLCKNHVTPMQFAKKCLIFILEVMVISIGVFLFLSIGDRPYGHPRWLRTSIKMESLTYYFSFEELEPISLELLAPGDFQLAELPDDITDSLSFVFQENKGYPDSWRNPLRVIITIDHGRKYLKFYSTGKDGISSTGGNDPDDINSWGQDGSLFYEAENKRAEKMKRLRIFGISCVISLAIVPFANWGFTKLLARGSLPDASEP